MRGGREGGGSGGWNGWEVHVKCLLVVSTLPVLSKRKQNNRTTIYFHILESFRKSRYFIGEYLICLC